MRVLVFAVCACVLTASIASCARNAVESPADKNSSSENLKETSNSLTKTEFYQVDQAVSDATRKVEQKWQIERGIKIDEMQTRLEYPEPNDNNFEIIEISSPLEIEMILPPTGDTP
jgi:hypothetical protein